MAGQIGWLEGLARQATVRAGSSWAFGLALAVVLVWLIAGPFFAFSDTWQLVINTGTTIMTFLMVFLIQRAQNKDSLAIQLKLNEIVASIDGASNHLINVEDLGEEDVGVLHKHYQKLAELVKHDHKVTQSHSIEEAERRYEQHPQKRLHQSK